MPGIENSALRETCVPPAVLNGLRAKGLGLEVPPSLLAIIDRLVDNRTDDGFGSTI